MIRGYTSWSAQPAAKSLPEWENWRAEQPILVWRRICVCIVGTRHTWPGRRAVSDSNVVGGTTRLEALLRWYNVYTVIWLPAIIGRHAVFSRAWYRHCLEKSMPIMLVIPLSLWHDSMIIIQASIMSVVNVSLLFLYELNTTSIIILFWVFKIFAIQIFMKYSFEINFVVYQKGWRRYQLLRNNIIFVDFFK